MKTIKLFVTLPLFLGLTVVLFQGCYTQFATMKEDRSSYEQEEQNSGQSDSTAYDNANYDDYDTWQPHNYIGFSYYYPGWRSYWAWDYGCVYPTYWDPFWWGPAFYAGYEYYPHHFGYWDSYPGYGRSNNYRSFVTRNSGYQRGRSNLRNSGVGRSSIYGNTGTGTIVNGRAGSSSGSINLPRASSTRTQLSGTGALKSHRRGAAYSGNSKGSVKSRNTTVHRSGNSQSRSQSSVRQSRTSAPAPRSTQSAPSQRNDGGGQHSSGSGRSRH